MRWLTLPGDYRSPDRRRRGGWRALVSRWDAGAAVAAYDRARRRSRWSPAHGDDSRGGPRRWTAAHSDAAGLRPDRPFASLAGAGTRGGDGRSRDRHALGLRLAGARHPARTGV